MGDVLFEDSLLLGRLESPGCCAPGRPGVPTASSGDYLSVHLLRGHSCSADS